MEANKTPSPSSSPQMNKGATKGEGDDNTEENGGGTPHRRGGRNKNRKRGQGARPPARRQQARRTQGRPQGRPQGRKGAKRHSKFSVPIVFVGMMGCGKTTIASALAAKLGQPFKDSDIEIERASNATVTEIFEQYGEDYFRDGERKVIKRLMQNNHTGIIATGGGAYMNDETRAWINQHGICVWLRADLETIWNRVSRKDSRPLLQRPDAKEFLSDLIAERTPIYEQAHVVVDVNNGTKMDMVRKTLGAIKAYVDKQRQLKNPKFMPKNRPYKNRSHSHTDGDKGGHKNKGKNAPSHKPAHNQQQAHIQKQGGTSNA